MDSTNIIIKQTKKMENPPDLIVVVAPEEQNKNKSKLLVETINEQKDKQQNELITKLQLDKYMLECQLQQLRAQIAARNNIEFAEQSRLLQQRFQDEIQSVALHHAELVQGITTDLSAYVTNILQKSIEDIESLRLLHQKELGAHSKMINDCIQHQSCEMNELCHHLINQQRKMPLNLFNTHIDNFQTALSNLKTSFDSKMNYLSDIHVSTIDKLNTKHETEIEEMKCELYLMSNR
ncbi:unnamed protein product [Rotaria magnacalcarata]